MSEWYVYATRGMRSACVVRGHLGSVSVEAADEADAPEGHTSVAGSQGSRIVTSEIFTASSSGRRPVHESDENGEVTTLECGEST